MTYRLKEHGPKAGAQALILGPTRELGIQLHKAVKELALLETSMPKHDTPTPFTKYICVAFFRLKEHSAKAGAQALILAPTRELVIQLHKAVKELARYTDLRLAVLVGGDSMDAQFAELAANPDIILATPGILLLPLSLLTFLMNV